MRDVYFGFATDGNARCGKGGPCAIFVKNTFHLAL